MKTSLKKVKNKSLTNYSESVNISLQSLNDSNRTAVSSNSSAQAENDNKVLEDNYLKEVFDEIFYNRRNLLVLKYHIKQICKVLKELESPVLSINVVKSLMNKRLKQFRCNTNVYFIHGSHLIELKVWETISEEVAIVKLKSLKELFMSISKFYKDYNPQLSRFCQQKYYKPLL